MSTLFTTSQRTPRASEKSTELLDVAAAFSLLQSEEKERERERGREAEAI